MTVFLTASFIFEGVSFKLSTISVALVLIFFLVSEIFLAIFSGASLINLLVFSTLSCKVFLSFSGAALIFSFTAVYLSPMFFLVSEIFLAIFLGVFFIVSTVLEILLVILFLVSEILLTIFLGVFFIVSTVLEIRLTVSVLISFRSWITALLRVLGLLCFPVFLKLGLFLFANLLLASALASRLKKFLIEFRPLCLIPLKNLLVFLHLPDLLPPLLFLFLLFLFFLTPLPSLVGLVLRLLKKGRSNPDPDPRETAFRVAFSFILSKTSRFSSFFLLKYSLRICLKLLIRSFIL